MKYRLDDLLGLALHEGASDLHLRVGSPPVLRLQGSLVPVEGPALEEADTEFLASELCTPEQMRRVAAVGQVDGARGHGAADRFRLHVFRAGGGYGLVLRLLPCLVPDLRTLGLPPEVVELLERPRGLFLVTGPTGSGKTTTLASMVDWMNRHRSGHILTIEDPVEYRHAHGRCLVTQREPGVDVADFASAVRAALRQDPDVLLVGEMRDLETIQAAVTAAETGHLVLATLHTTGAVRTVDRIVDAFPAATREEVRIQLASSLLAVVSQVLCARVDGGRQAAFEVMVATTAIAQQIRENRTFRIHSDLQTGGRHGMIPLDSSLRQLVERGHISRAEALRRAQRPDELSGQLAGT
jgi:twitching motility protein PilT